MKNNKFWLWFPRILTIIFTLFLSLFALDAFAGDAPLIEKIGGFLIHLIPSYLLIAILIVAWKKPKIGGFVFIILSIIFTLYFRTYTYMGSFIAVSLPVAVIGGLYILSHVLLNKKTG